MTKERERTTTSGDAPEMLTIEKLKALTDQIPSIVIPVFWFTPYIAEDKGLQGEAIDKLLNCKGNEKGFIFHTRYRLLIENHRSKTSLFPAFIVRGPNLRSRTCLK